MAAMTTALELFQSNGNSTTYLVSNAHTVQRPRLVIQRRRVPTGNQVVSESQVSVVYGTIDSDGLPIPQKVTFTAIIKQPINIKSGETDVAAALALFREFVASDEMSDVVTKQLPIA